MRCSLPPHPHDLYPTSLDPPESTQHPPVHFAWQNGTGFGRHLDDGGFHLRGETNHVPPKTPGGDPIDPHLPLQAIAARSVRPRNALDGVCFRHTAWAANRERVLQGLHQFEIVTHDYRKHFTDAPELYNPDYHPPSRRELRFADCGTRSVVLRHATDPTRFKIACERCHDRFCLPCMQDRARLVVANMKAQLSYEPTRFLTLTLKHSDEPLHDQLIRLYKSFYSLRHRAFWSDHVTGGIAFLELKLSRNDNRWHPHLHVLLRGSYLPQKLVRDAWLQITGDSHIIDITLIRSPEQLYSYLTKYVTKGWDTGMYRDLPRLVEAMIALQHRKLLTCFGEFAHLRLLLPPTTETWIELGTLHELFVLHQRGVPWAMAAYAALFTSAYQPAPVEIPDDGW